MPAIPPTISPSTAPRDALNQALAWLAEVVDDVAVVRSKQVLRRTRGPVHLEVNFRSSYYSRREIGAWADLSVQVRDTGFGRWRSQHPELVWRTSGLVHSTGSLPPDVVLYGDEAGYRQLADLPELIRSGLLPMLDMFDSPARLASEYDTRRSIAAFVFSCMEWAVYKGDIEAARTLLTRYVDGAHPAMRARIDQARAAGRPPRGTAIRHDFDRDAPTLETLGILAPGEPLPGSPGPDIPVRDSKSRLRAILSEFGRVAEVGAD